MAYVLVTEDGRFMRFYLEEVAHLYRMIFGGQVIRTTDLNDFKSKLLWTE
jgi:hypothetical protein